MFRLPVYTPCPFCEYVAGRPVHSPVDGELTECAVVDETEHTLAFVNTRRPLGVPANGPPAPWVLVITKRHAATLLDLSAAEAAAAMTHVRRIARALTGGFELDGLRLLQNNGMAGDQTVPHFHMHLLPCLQGGASGPEGLKEHGPFVAFAERQRMAERIRAYLEP